MTDYEKQLRQNIRNYLYPMTPTEMEKELEISHERRDALRIRFIEEYIAECNVVPPK
jgi:hypothetical protein